MTVIQFFKGWSFERYFRLVLAILVGVYAVSSKEYVLFIVTGWLGVLALLNVSCCGTAGCSSPPKASKTVKKNESIDVNYEEIK